MVSFPSKKELMDSIVEVLTTNNSTMTTSDINDCVAKKLHLTEEQLNEESSSCSGSEYSYRMRWARTELRQKNIISNPQRGKWQLV